MNENIISVNMNFTYLQRSIDELIDESSKFKSGIFRNLIMKNNSKGVTNDYKVAINSFLKAWSDLSNDVLIKLNSIDTKSCSMDFEVLEYNYVKNVLFAKYDYASILQFVDGIMKGISSGDMSSPSDIENFK